MQVFQHVGRVITGCHSPAVRTGSRCFVAGGPCRAMHMPALLP